MTACVNAAEVMKGIGTESRQGSSSGEGPHPLKKPVQEWKTEPPVSLVQKPENTESV